MSDGGWRSFREASKHKAIAATAAAELERPAVSHRVSIQPLDEPALKVHETTPSTAPILPDEEPPLSDEPVASEESSAPDDEAPNEQDPDQLVAAAVAMMTPAWPVTPAARSRLRSNMKRSSNLKGILKSVGPWYALAIVPVAGAASLIAMRAGLNPYAFCLQWWDLMFGAVVASAAGLFIGFAMWRGLKDAWQPGAPALGMLAVAAPLWLAISLANGSGCGIFDARAATAAPAIMVPPLPPPVAVGPVWAVPMPQQRPPELHFQFSPQQLDIETGQLDLRRPL